MDHRRVLILLALPAILAFVLSPEAGQPFTASLAASGATLSNMHAETHPSLPNYLALWSGSTYGVTNDNCPPDGAPYSTPNLGQECEAAGLSWRAYSEDLPGVGSTACYAANNKYARKHEPWSYWDNVDHARERPYTDLAADVAKDSLPALAFVIPNQDDDAHDQPSAFGDEWLAHNIPAMLNAVGDSGVVILTWDEDELTEGNRILTLFAGRPVAEGAVTDRAATHYTLLRTICDALGLAPCGEAARDSALTDIWAAPDSAVPTPRSELALGAPWPNPTAGAVSARLSVPVPAYVWAGVYDVRGRRVAELAKGLVAGDVTLHWDGNGPGGHPAPSGVYVMRVNVYGVNLQRTFVRTR